MKKLRNKKVTKFTVGDLKNSLKGVPNDTEVVLAFYLKDEPNKAVYLADVMTNLKYDSVVKERLFNNNVVELIGYSHEFCTYVEKHDE